MKSHSWLLLAAALCISATTSIGAQDSPPPQGPRPGPGGGQPKGPPPNGERRPGPPGGFSRNSMGPMQSEGFERLPEEEKQKVRAAMGKVWGTPAVQEARDRYMKAGEDFRQAMTLAIKEADPEVVAILEKIKPRSPFPANSLPKLPPPDDPGFASAAVTRMGEEMIAFAKPEHRETNRRLHERIIQMPVISAAIEQIKQAAPAQRMDAFGKLREAYRAEVMREVQKLREQKEKGAAEDATKASLPPEK